MTPEFSTAFGALLGDLTKDLRSWSPKTQLQIAPQIFETLPPPPSGPVDVDAEYPMVCWCVYKGELSAKPQPIEVLVDFGVKVDEESGTTIEQIRLGSAHVKEMIRSMQPFSEGKTRRVGGYRLQLPLNFTIGDQSPGFEGAQPHPYYHGRVYLRFLPM